MADTDSPLKQLFSAFITDFAACLLQAEVREAHPLNIELPAETLAADQVFHVTLVDGRWYYTSSFRGAAATSRWSGACWNIWCVWRTHTAWTCGVW